MLDMSKNPRLMNKEERREYKKLIDIAKEFNPLIKTKEVLGYQGHQMEVLDFKKKRTIKRQHHIYLDNIVFYEHEYCCQFHENIL